MSFLLFIWRQKSPTYIVCVYGILTHRIEQSGQNSKFTFSFFRTLVFNNFFMKTRSGVSLVKHQWRSGHKIQHWHYLLWLSITSASILNKYFVSLCLPVYVFLLFSFGPSHRQVPLVFPPTFPRLITAQGVYTETKHEFEMWFLIKEKLSWWHAPVKIPKSTDAFPDDIYSTVSTFMSSPMKLCSFV